MVSTEHATDAFNLLWLIPALPFAGSMLIFAFGKRIRDSGVLASALCMDKSRAGKVMAGAGLHVPEFEELEIKEGVASEVVERLVSRFGLSPGGGDGHFTRQRDLTRAHRHMRPRRERILHAPQRGPIPLFGRFLAL